MTETLKLPDEKPRLLAAIVAAKYIKAMERLEPAVEKPNEKKVLNSDNKFQIYNKKQEMDRIKN